MHKSELSVNYRILRNGSGWGEWQNTEPSPFWVSVLWARRETLVPAWAYPPDAAHFSLFYFFLFNSSGVFIFLPVTVWTHRESVLSMALTKSLSRGSRLVLQLSPHFSLRHPSFMPIFLHRFQGAFWALREFTALTIRLNSLGKNIALNLFVHYRPPACRWHWGLLVLSWEPRRTEQCPFPSSAAPPLWWHVCTWPAPCFLKGPGNMQRTPRLFPLCYSSWRVTERWWLRPTGSSASQWSLLSSPGVLLLTLASLLGLLPTNQFRFYLYGLHLGKTHHPFHLLWQKTIISLCAFKTKCLITCVHLTKLLCTRKHKNHLNNPESCYPETISMCFSMYIYHFWSVNTQRFKKNLKKESIFCSYIFLYH